MCTLTKKQAIELVDMFELETLIEDDEEYDLYLANNPRGLEAIEALLDVAGIKK